MATNAPQSTPASSGILSGFTRLSKLFCAIVLLFYGVAKFYPTSQAYLALVPGRTIPCIWNIVTSQFLETNGLLVSLDIFAILFLAKIVEPVYGSKEFLKFNMAVLLSAGGCMFSCLFLSYLFGPRMGFILYGKYCGFQALLAGYLVSVKQIMPENELRLLFIFKLKAKYLPGAYVLLASSVAGMLQSYYSCGLVICGAYFAWVYLRFFQSKLDGRLTGDPSEEFRFATFFPEIFHPIVDRLAIIFFCCSARKDATLQTNAAHGQPLPGSDAQESNRRRERGARALEERLSGKTADIESAARDAEDDDA